MTHEVAIARVLAQMTRDGLAEIVVDLSTGQQRWRLTAEGRAAADRLVTVDPEAAAFYREVMARHLEPPREEQG